MGDQPDAAAVSDVPYVSSDVDFWSYLARGFGYWLVAVTALLAGAYYADGAFLVAHAKALLVFSFTLYPCYVIYATVYDLDPAARLHPPPSASFARKYFRGSSNETWVAVAVLAWIVWPVLLWAVGPQHPLLTDISGIVGGLPAGYAAILFFCHCYYAFWMLRGRHDPRLARVRYEALIPVMIVAFSFFVGATIFDTRFHASLYILPALIFIFFGVMHGVDLSRTRSGGALPARSFARAVTVFIIAIPVATAAIGLMASGDLRAALEWASSVTVAVSVGLYLSLFELWRLTGKINERTELGVSRSESAQNYYHATVVSHAVAIAALPLVYLFGRLSWLFVAIAIGHATTAFFIWYWLSGPHVEFNRPWRLTRLVFAFTFFGVLVFGVHQRQPIAAMPDRYPRDLSGISASLFVALLFAFLATPFVQYFTEEDGRSGQARPFVAVLKSFFKLRHKFQVFRLAAVLSGALFIGTDFLYEMARSLSWGITGKASVVFWIYAGTTVFFSACAFFAGADRGQRNPSSGGGTNRVAVLTGLIGAVQSLRVLTGSIVFLGVLLIGLATTESAAYSGVVAFAVALVAMASFALNDYYDWRKDAINAPHRAIPSGRLSPTGALSIGLGALMVGTVVGLRVLSGVGLLVFLVGAIGGASYNEFVRRCPHLKGMATGVLCGLIVFFDVLAFGLPSNFAWLGCACVVFVAGRELLMDVRDRNGDAEVGMLTLAVRWGDARASVLAFALLLLSSLPLAAFVRSGGGGPEKWWPVFAYCATIAVAVLIWHAGPWPRRRWVAIEVLKAAMVVGIVSMIAR
jgi:geranylgeranylglycerol-phosphate geranylgeranyltransferase